MTQASRARGSLSWERIVTIPMYKMCQWSQVQLQVSGPLQAQDLAHHTQGLKQHCSLMIMKLIPHQATLEMTAAV